MAHKKAGGSTALGRDSQPKYLGIKLYGGQKVEPGMIIVRQRGTRFHPGQNVKIGADDTLYAQTAGIINFYTRKVKNFTGNLVKRKFVSVV